MAWRLTLGFQYKTALKGLTLGIAMQNFGPDLRFDGPDLDRVVKLQDAVPEADPQAGVAQFPHVTGSG